MCEEAGVPSSSLVSQGFLQLAAASSIGLGFPSMPVALVPGHPGAQSPAMLRRNILEVTTAEVIKNLMQASGTGQTASEPQAQDIVFAGGFDAVNQLFLKKEWSDGLPIVPPTRAKVEAFLRYTNRKPDEVLGVLLPDNRAATIWSIAVNGVMAGCRPEYMPILVALVQAMADPAYGVEHSGNTPGGETLIILNGPIVQQLGFNYRENVLRDGFQPNTSVGRFWRLYLRNVAGFLLHKNDKATFGNTWRVVAAENEEVLRSIGWSPTSVEMGFQASDNTVTIARYTGGNLIASVSGSTPEEIMPIIADAVIRQHSWQITFTVGGAYGTLRPLILLSPILAEAIAQGGWSKQAVKQ
ncbi:MAG: UGSC family (seleno)protein, partial [Alcaligenaceae bacterium]